MQNIVGSDQDPDFLARGHDQRLIDFEQIMLALRLLIVDLGRRRSKIAVEAHPLVQVIIVPLPLIAGHLDRHVGRRSVLHGENGLGGREGHE